MIHLIITGAAGRMGEALIKVLPSFADINLVGAIDAVGHIKIGKTAYPGIKFTTDLASIIKKSDVVIDFSGAEPSINHLKTASAEKIPVVIGSTGHTADQKANIVSISKKIPVVYSPNMSIGVNVMWKLIEEGIKALGKDYQIDIVETHHVHKKDTPSGTAKRILEIVADAGGYDLNKDVFCHVEGVEAPKSPIKVKSIREGEIVGNHSIIFTNPYERLEITHRAFSREVFAAGALRAASWIIDKPAGLYNMGDVLNF